MMGFVFGRVKLRLAHATSISAVHYNFLTQGHLPEYLLVWTKANDRHISRQICIWK